MGRKTPADADAKIHHEPTSVRLGTIVRPQKKGNEETGGKKKKKKRERTEATQPVTTDTLVRYDLGETVECVLRTPLQFTLKSRSQGLVKGVRQRTPSASWTSASKRTAHRLPHASGPRPAAEILARALLTRGRDGGVRGAAATFLQGVVFGGGGALGRVQRHAAVMLRDMLVVAERADQRRLVAEMA